jgi:hypothetical protein
MEVLSNMYQVSLSPLITMSYPSQGYVNIPSASMGSPFMYIYVEMQTARVQLLSIIVISTFSLHLVPV